MINLSSRTMLAGNAGRILDLRSARRVQIQPDAEPWEWDETVSGTTITVAGGSVVFGGSAIGADTDYEVAGAAGYLYAEVNLSASTVTCAFSETRPVDNVASSIYRFALSFWEYTPADGDIPAVLTKTKTLHKGAIHIVPVFAP